MLKGEGNSNSIELGNTCCNNHVKIWFIFMKTLVPFSKKILKLCWNVGKKYLASFFFFTDSKPLLLVVLCNYVDLYISVSNLQLGGCCLHEVLAHLLLMFQLCNHGNQHQIMIINAILHTGIRSWCKSSFRARQHGIQFNDLAVFVIRLDTDTGEI